MKFLKIIVCLLAVQIVSTAAHANRCMTANADGQVAQGRLAVGRYKDAAGRSQSAYVLLMAQHACLSAQEAGDRVGKSAKIHVFSSDDGVHRKIHKFIGKAVRVHGRPGAAHTVHHRAPIIMDITTIDAN